MGNIGNTKDQFVRDLQNTIADLKHLATNLTEAATRSRDKELSWVYAMEGNRDGVWDWNAVTNEVFFSPRWKEMLGFDENEIMNALSEWDKRIHPDDKESVYADLNDHLEGRTPYYENEHRLKCKDGSYKWILDRGKILSWTEDGKPLRVVGTHTDVSARKEAEAKLEQQTAELIKANEALKNSEEKFRSLSEAAFEGIVILDQGIIVEANEKIARMFGYDLSEVIGMEGIRFISPEERGKVQRKISSGDERAYESIGLKGDGTLFPIEVHARVFEHKGKQVRVSAVRDLTEKRLTEKALKQSERNMASVLNNTQDGIARIDRNFRYIFANPALYAATGFTPEQYLGKTNNEIGMPEELCTFWHEIHESVFQNRKPEIVEFTFITANKGERVLQAVVTPEFDDTREVSTIICVMRDITEIKRAEYEKNAVIEKLQKALAEIKTLRGFIPICANCKNIRDDKGYWQQIEQYIQDRSDAQFSHSLCPKCAKELYPDLPIL